jgi:hypothetical protein
MTDLEQKKLLISRITAHLNPVPENCVQELLGQSLGDLQVILGKLADTKDQEQAEEATLAHAQEMILKSKADHAWAFALAKVSMNDGRFLVDAEANRNMLEGMLQPHEEPSPAIYETILKQYSAKFSWATPQANPTKEDQRKAFQLFVRENDLSSVDANFSLFQQGASIENFAGASQIERQKYANEQAQARQHFLINSATPSELKAEAVYQSQTERAVAVKAEADRQHQYVSQQQAGLYPALPSTMADTGEVIDAKFLRRLSTIDFPRFKQLIKRYGTAGVTARLRGEN